MYDALENSSYWTQMIIFECGTVHIELVKYICEQSL